MHGQPHIRFNNLRFNLGHVHFQCETRRKRLKSTSVSKNEKNKRSLYQTHISLPDIERFHLQGYHDKSWKKKLQQNTSVSREPLQLMKHCFKIHRNTLHL